MKRLLVILSVLLLLVFLSTTLSVAQSEDGFTIRMRRDFGYSSGTGDIQGLFSITAEGPGNLERVVFLVDDQQIGEDGEAPFKVQFSTDSYSIGKHTIHAVGYTANGVELASNEFRVNFVPAGEGAKAAVSIVVGLLGLIGGVMALSFIVTMTSTRRKGSLPLGAERNYGWKGGAICKNCQRPFAFHFFAFNLLTNRFDFCPHCGKWQLAHRSSLEALRQAEVAELEAAQGSEQIQGLSDEEKLRRDLDASRYQE